jgi:hypothetical protein
VHKNAKKMFSTFDAKNRVVDKIYGNPNSCPARIIYDSKIRPLSAPKPVIKWWKNFSYYNGINDIQCDCKTYCDHWIDGVLHITEKSYIGWFGVKYWEYYGDPYHNNFTDTRNENKRKKTRKSKTRDKERPYCMKRNNDIINDFYLVKK